MNTSKLRPVLILGIACLIALPELEGARGGRGGGGGRLRAAPPGDHAGRGAAEVATLKELRKQRR